MIELLLPGWLAGMMLACAAGPLRLVCGLAPDVLFRRYAGAHVATGVAFGFA